MPFLPLTNAANPRTGRQARVARRAYYAATTGMDEEVGRLLAGVEARGLSATTAILLHGDHGWQLGERAGWSKNANWEAAVRVPFVLAVPWLPVVAGTASDALVELVDVLPTLCDLAGVAVPAEGGDAAEPPEGTSLLPLLLTPNATNGTKPYAFSQYPRRVKEGQPDWDANGIDHVDPANFSYMGYSVRSEQWRYTEWRAWDGARLAPANWTAPPYATELYDWRDCNDSACLADIDYNLWENVNVAEDFPETAAQLSAVVRAQFDFEKKLSSVNSAGKVLVL